MTMWACTIQYSWDYCITIHYILGILLTNINGQQRVLNTAQLMIRKELHYPLHVPCRINLIFQEAFDAARMSFSFIFPLVG